MGVNIQTIKDIRNHLAGELKEIYPETEIEALTRIIIDFTAGEGKKFLITPENRSPVTKETAEKVIAICAGLKDRKPIQYILGETFFYGCTIRVTADTLIPRQETEVLVDLIIKENRGYSGTIIDIGTGSGCIAVALAVNLPGSHLLATDISPGALAVASGNAALNNVAVSFFNSDIFDPDFQTPGTAGIIVSNPPYVRDSEKKLMNRNVLDFEPHTALFVSDNDPLVYYRAILGFARRVLNPGGKLYLEINEALGTELAKLIESSGYYTVKVVKDLNEKDRIIKAIKNV